MASKKAKIAARKRELDNLNIVASCHITRMEINYTTDKAELALIDDCLYTPKSIAQALKKHNITGSTWIIGPTGKELWKPNGELAKQL